MAAVIRGSTLKEPAVAQASLKKRWCGRLSCSDKKTLNKEVMIPRVSVSKTRKLYCILIAEVYLTNILPPVPMIFPLCFILKYMNTLPLIYCRFNSQNCSWVAAAATENEKLGCKTHNICATVSQKWQNTRTFAANVSVHYWENLYITLFSSNRNRSPV